MKSCKRPKFHSLVWSPAHSGSSLTAEVSGRSRAIAQFIALFLTVKECLLDYFIMVLHPTMRPYVADAFLAILQDRVAVLSTSVSNIDCTGSFYFHFLG